MHHQFSLTHYIQVMERLPMGFPVFPIPPKHVVNGKKRNSNDQITIFSKRKSPEKFQYHVVQIQV